MGTLSKSRDMTGIAMREIAMKLAQLASQKQSQH
jgi:DNA-directed RNA polymerase subunit K/omega